MEKENNYTNEVAYKFKKWSKRILDFASLEILVGFIAILASFESGATFLITFLAVILVVGTTIANSLFISAIAEIIQKLQNIEDNIGY